MTFDSLEANEASGQRGGLAPLQAAAIGWLLRVIDEQGRSADSPTPTPALNRLSQGLFGLIYDWGAGAVQLCRGQAL